MNASYDNRNGPTWWVLAIICGIAIQAIGFGMWIGSIQTEVAGHDKWINGRDTKNFDVRLGILEREEDLDSQSIARMRQDLQNHITTDGVRLKDLEKATPP